MPNEILKLVRLITALYYSSLLKKHNNDYHQEIIMYYTKIKAGSKSTLTLNSETIISEALKLSIEWMINNSNEPFILANLLHRFEINCATNTNSEYISLIKSQLIEVSAEEAERRLNGILKELRYEDKQDEIKRIILDANKRINFNTGTYINLNSTVRELIDNLSNISDSSDGEEVHSLLSRINFKDYNSVYQTVKKALETKSVEGMLNTGIVGLNKMLGGYGLSRGEYINFSALPHNYKSGILIDLALNIPRFNKPFLFNKDKKPLVLRISLENTAEQDIIVMYKKIYQLKYKADPIINNEAKPSEEDIQKATEEVKSYFDQFGYEFILEAHDANEFNIHDFFYIVNELIRSGYEIHLISFDYLKLMAENTKVVDGKLTTKILKTADMARSFCHPKGITLATAHQLSSDANAVREANPIGFVKSIANSNYYEDCRSLHTKFDVGIVMNILEHADGSSYLMLGRGKHRGGDGTPAKWRNPIIKFEPIGGIIPDYGTDAPNLFYKIPDVNVIEDVYGF